MDFKKQQEKKSKGQSIRALSPVSTSRTNNRKHNMSRLTVDVPNNSTHNAMEDSDQYDLTPVFSAGSPNPRGPNTPSYSIDPWEVVVSPPTSPNDTSLDSDKPPRIIMTRTSGDSRGNQSCDNRDGGVEDEDDNGYDPDDEEENDMNRINSNNMQGDEHNNNSNNNGIIRTSNPANRFLVPSDIHPNMEQRDEDIAQLRLLAGKLNADWRGQDFMAPALARFVSAFAGFCCDFYFCTNEILYVTHILFCADGYATFNLHRKNAERSMAMRDPLVF